MIKNFIEEGGMVLANADCGREQFSKSFEGLGRALFGGVSANCRRRHPVFTHQQFPPLDGAPGRRCLGLSNDVRELMVLLPDADPARYWQDPAAIRSTQTFSSWVRTCTNTAIDRQLWNRGESHFLRADPEAKTVRTVKLARLTLGPNWDPETRGWRRMAAMLRNETRSSSTFSPPAWARACWPRDHRPSHRTTDFRIDDVAAIELKSFVQNGGT